MAMFCPEREAHAEHAFTPRERGTLRWTAPEIVAGPAALPAAHEALALLQAADVWALGCTALELIMGAPPWWWVSANSGDMSLYLVGEDMRAHIPLACSPLLRDFIARCLHPDAHTRPSAAAMLQHGFITRAWSVARPLQQQVPAVEAATDGDPAKLLAQCKELLTLLALARRQIAARTTRWRSKVRAEAMGASASDVDSVDADASQLQQYTSIQMSDPATVHLLSRSMDAVGGGVALAGDAAAEQLILMHAARGGCNIIPIPTCDRVAQGIRQRLEAVELADPLHKFACCEPHSADDGFTYRTSIAALHWLACARLHLVHGNEGSSWQQQADTIAAQLHAAFDRLHDILHDAHAALYAAAHGAGHVRASVVAALQHSASVALAHVRVRWTHLANLVNMQDAVLRVDTASEGKDPAGASKLGDSEGESDDDELDASAGDDAVRRSAALLLKCIEDEHAQIRVPAPDGAPSALHVLAPWTSDATARMNNIWLAVAEYEAVAVEATGGAALSMRVGDLVRVHDMDASGWWFVEKLAPQAMFRQPRARGDVTADTLWPGSARSMETPLWTSVSEADVWTPSTATATGAAALAGVSTAPCAWVPGSYLAAVSL